MPRRELQPTQLQKPPGWLISHVAFHGNVCSTAPVWKGLTLISNHKPKVHISWTTSAWLTSSTISPAALTERTDRKAPPRTVGAYAPQPPPPNPPLHWRLPLKASTIIPVRPKNRITGPTPWPRSLKSFKRLVLVPGLQSQEVWLRLKED